MQLAHAKMNMQNIAQSTMFRQTLPLPYHLEGFKFAKFERRR